MDFAEAEMTLTGITPNQARVLRYIGSYWDQHGFSPSIREISSALGFPGQGTVH